MTISLDRPTHPVSVVAPDPAVRWLALLALAVGGFAIGTTEFVAMGLLPEPRRGFGITIPTAATHLGLRDGRRGRCSVDRGAGARLPRKELLLGLMVVFTLGNLATVLAPSTAR